YLELVSPASIFSDYTWGPRNEHVVAPVVLSLLSAMSIWIIVWYLVSHLSALVRERDTQLEETNERMAAALKERAQHLLVTTHELKSPFAAIHANAKLLQEGHCGTLPDCAVDITRRISARCRRLTAVIQEMLQLANLTSASQSELHWQRVDLRDILRWCIDQVGPRAQQRKITFAETIESAHVRGVVDHLKILFTNLLSNAVTYSHPGGCVRVRCAINASGEPVTTVSDDGIGIPAEKLPRIFEEHYRTNEAVKHNKESSGLGLAIVRQVAQMHKIHLQVESADGKGTTFRLRFRPCGIVSTTRQAEEMQDGLFDDC
ncbi:MAG: HAMP domain-containing histidine kinase, partial [Planctomycetes bacterium]|nr:HAMP domain-containing histidine kinase [Planctomycetota bacterium]